jgi:SAM-dependent methyltransferase
MLASPGTSQIRWSRWVSAQEYERAFWQKRATAIAAGREGQLDWYDWKARQLDARLTSLPDPLPRTGRVLEIGSGPVGIVNGLSWGERIAIDPLERFYREQPSLVHLRRPGTSYVHGTGEQLPVADESCALVIIENVIDHTYAPARILREIARVLEPRGCLYLLVNAHTRWGAMLHDALAALRIDRGHPYTFTPGTLRTFLETHGFAIQFEDIEPYARVRQANRRSANLTDRIKGHTGLSEFQHAVICRKDLAGGPSR